MKIGVISDTHIPERADKLPAEVFNLFKGVDLIIHAGDLTSLKVLDILSSIAMVKAVCGNMDPALVRQKLPVKETIKIDKFSIGVIHGRGYPGHLIDFAGRQFSKETDVIIFGHSHRPCNEKRGKTLFFNPGSPTDKIFSPYNSCGILQINNVIKGEIVRLR